MLRFETVKDERGNTYVAPLPHPVTVGYFETRKATHVMVWFNRDTRDWVVSYSCNDYGTQVGGSEYVGTRDWANDNAQELYDRAAATKPGARVDLY